MDTFPQAPAWRHEQSRSQSVAPRVLRKGDYLIGISLLLVVVFLWTSSNFITQVSNQLGLVEFFVNELAGRIYSRKDTRNPSCEFLSSFLLPWCAKNKGSVTYLNTGSFVIYLVPFFIRRTLDRRRSRWAMCLFALLKLLTRSLQYCRRVSALN